MKKLSSIDALDYVYKQEKKETFIPKYPTLVRGSTIAFTYNGLGDCTYTRPFVENRGKGFRICFGGQMIVDALEMPQYIRNPKEMKQYMRKCVALFRGFFYHEIGHLRYTDMSDDRFIKYKEKKYVNFLHSLFNILEDYVIETYGMGADYPYTVKYFDYVIQKVFTPQATQYTDDPDSPNSFLNYLLLRLRLKSEFKGKNSCWEADKKNLSKMVTNILLETDATERITKSILLGEYLIKNHPNWKFQEVQAPQTSPIGQTAPGTPGAGVAPATGPQPTNPNGVGQGGVHGVPQPGGTGSGKVSNNRGADCSGEDGPIKKKEEMLPGEEKEVKETYNPDNDMLPSNCPHINDAFNDVLPENGGNHEWIIAKEYCTPTAKVTEYVDGRLKSVSGLANSIKQAFNVFKGRTRPRYYRGKKAGLVDMRKAMTNALTHGCDTKLFQKKYKKGKDADLVVSILCDNSGSMSGPKSHICTTAMLALALACKLTKIPLEVNAFVSSGKNYTIKIKDFEDSFDTAKQFFGLTDSDVYGYYNSDLACRQFCSNQDEVNLYYVYKELTRNEHRDKLIIVISDGATCGSTERLRNIVKMIEKDGISIIGLGIDCDAVASIYPNHQLFFGDEGLKALPSFLTTTLLKFAKGGK